jgi:tetratricopeptide (TPR) repeat protein
MAGSMRHAFSIAMVCPALAVAWLAALPPPPAWAQKPNAATLCRTEKSEAGIAACTAVLKRKGDLKTRASALLARGQAYWALNRLVEAEKDYSETIRLVPNFMALYRDRGQIRFGLGNAAGAMEDFTVAIEKDPFDADNHANRGYLKMQHYDFEGAREDFRKGLFWKKDHPRSHYMMGLLHYSTGQYRDAITAITQARTLGFKGNEGFITKARSHFYLNAHDLAEKEATEGLASFPAVYDLSEIRARARLAQNRTADALADAETVVEAAPRYGRAYATRAAVRLAMKELNGARADADKAIELDPKLFDAVQVKAEILLAAGDKAGARALYAQSAARTDAKMAYDRTSRNVAAARIVELDAPPPVIVAELPEAELKTRCEKRDDPLRMPSCDRLVETAATPEARAGMLILRSRAQPFERRLPDLDLAVEAAPDYLPATLARGYALSGNYFPGADLAPLERAFADGDSVVRRAKPGSDELLQGLGLRSSVGAALGRYEVALADLTRTLELRPDTVVSMQADRAEMLLMLGRPAEAVAAARDSDSRIAPDKAFLRRSHTLVLALIESGDVPSALAETERWKQRNPGQYAHQDALRARALLARGDDAGARDTANGVLAQRERDLAARGVRGIAHARLGNALDAVSDIDAVIDGAKDPTTAVYDGLTPGFMSELYLHRGLARAQLRQASSARSDLGEAIKRTPDRARPYAERARLALMADNPAALTDIAMALRIEPAEPRWLALAARIHHATGDLAAAERSVDLALAAGASEPDLVLLRAKARLALGKFGAAAEDATARLASAPTDAEAHLVRIEARAGAGDLKAALTEAEAARSAIAGDHRILLILGEMKARSGDAAGAIGAFEDAASRPEAALAANKRLGDLYAGLASDQLALGYYAKALEARGQGVNDEVTKTAARTARDALIRKMAAPK